MTQRLKQLILHKQAIPQLFRSGQLVTKGLPKNSRIVDFTYDSERALYKFTVANEAFEPVEKGDEIPELHVEMLDTQLENVESKGLEHTDTLY